MNKKLMLVVVATLMTVVANAWPQRPPVLNQGRNVYQVQQTAAITAARAQQTVNQLAYTGGYPMAVQTPVAACAAKTCNTPGVGRTVYVRAKHKTVNTPNGKVRVYVPAHYETRVGTYR